MKLGSQLRKVLLKKKNRIIKKGFELMCNQGYHNVTCADIARYSGVSVGIIYQYFNDKRDIFLEGVRDYASMILFPALDSFFIKKIDGDSLEELISRVIDVSEQNHTVEKDTHEELIGMSHLDHEVSKCFCEKEFYATLNFSSLLKQNGIVVSNSCERVHIVVGLIDYFCHEVVYHKHKDMDYEVMKKLVIQTILYLLRS